MSRPPCFDREYLLGQIAGKFQVSIPGVGIVSDADDVPSQEELDALRESGTSSTTRTISHERRPSLASIVAPAAASLGHKGAENDRGDGDPGNDDVDEQDGDKSGEGDKSQGNGSGSQAPTVVKYANRPLSEYVGKTAEEIRKMPGVGDSTLKKIVEALAAETANQQ